MKTLFKILFILFFSGNLYSQTKEELIASINRINVVDNASNFERVPDSLKISIFNIKNFRKLLELISEKELLNYSKGENKILRVYAIEELLRSKNKKFDFVLAFKSEVEKNETVETSFGCDGGPEKIPFLIYQKYCKTSKDVEIENDITLQKLDSIILSSKKSLSLLLYASALGHRKPNDFLLPEIEDLAFKRNNCIAIYHLKENYPGQYTARIESYLLNDFPNAKFKFDGTDGNDFVNIIEMLLRTGNEKMRSIAIEKLRQNPFVDRIDEYWYKEHNIKL